MEESICSGLRSFKNNIFFSTVTTTQDKASFAAVLLFLYAFVHTYTYIATNN
jgi:hypothetical protein